MNLKKDELLKIYYYMKLIRAIDDRASKLYRQGKLFGGVYSGWGNEATAIGSAWALDKEDILAPLQRDVGATLVRGFTPAKIFAQYMGKKTGYTRGKDLNLHMGDLKLGVIAPISMLGETVVVCSGIALSFKLRREKRVVLTYIGDGGTSTGLFHEGMNFAGVHKLPMVVICENNQYAYSTPLSKQTALVDLVDRAKAYGIPGVIVDGNDVLAVYEVTKAAVENARSGKGPTFIESKTMRMRGHAEHDDAFYVPKQLLEEWAKKDPIDRFEKYLRNRRILNKTIQSEIETRIEKEIEEAVQFAENSPWPEPEEALEGVYAD